VQKQQRVQEEEQREFRDAELECAVGPRGSSAWSSHCGNVISMQ